jgi:hypothetical protein
VSEDIRIVGVSVGQPSAISDEDAAHHIQERLPVKVEIENAADKPLHVWSTRRSFDFDPRSGVLTLKLAETDTPPPPGIRMISNHPRVPSQVVVDAGERATLEIPVPTMVRRRVPGEGLGMSFIEEPIQDIQQVEVHLQYADVPFQPIVEESPEQRRQRLGSHGRVVTEILEPTFEKESADGIHQ